ncbi:hypothetical protein D0469_03635 [Peribacillus saganii]|uniref:Lipoprotein n=1 Tax=Peribacillus saganii TaxID=2303992 RepID=A0A372LTB8_9BACI|nr:hypothetical protein [Peribacillus saganii]RFU71042.1 hypothetical protein D0469_03635 [Peribacillus saganii]
MKSLKTLFIGASVAGLLLSGCGTQAQPEKSEAPKEKAAEQPATEEKENTNTAGNTESETESATEPSEQTDTATEDAASTQSETASETKTTVRTPEQNLQFSINGEEKQATAFLKKSDNQNFSLYVLPEYELTGEEPNKDLLFFKESEDISMRIELLPENADWAAAEENVRAQLQAVSETITAPSDPKLAISNGVALEAASGDDIVTSFLFKDAKNPFKLTIFTTKKADHRQALLEMGKTVLKN